MPNACTVLLIKSSNAENLACMCQTTYFIQEAHLHKRLNRLCKNLASGHRDLEFYSILASVNGSIMTASETNSIKGSITTLLEIYISSITEYSIT